LILVIISLRFDVQVNLKIHTEKWIVSGKQADTAASHMKQEKIEGKNNHL